LHSCLFASAFLIFLNRDTTFSLSFQEKAMKIKQYSKIFEGENITIYDLGDHESIGLVVWSGFIKIDDPQRLYELERTIANVKNKGIKVYISDCRRLKASSEVLIRWMHEVWYPQCYKHGLRCEVVIEAENALGQIGLMEMIAKSGEVSVIRAKNFPQALQEAENALEEIKTNELLDQLGF
jgi:hypothetical protein